MYARSVAIFVVVLFSSSVCPGFAQAGQADAWGFTAGPGDQGIEHDNDPTSDITMTENNNPAAFFVQPPSNTTTATTRQHSYQEITNSVRTRTGLLAPLSTMQFGDSRSFKWAYDLGFPPPKGVTGPGVLDPQGQNWSPGGNTLLPDTGTPSVSLDVTIGGGY